MTVIAVGSTNKVKIGAVQAIARQVWPACQVVGVQVPSGVSDMPLSDEECIEGARNRAKAALSAVKDAAYGVGLEGGVMTVADQMMLVGWVVVVDQYETVGLGSAARIPLPAFIAERVRQGEELGPVMDDVVKGHNTKQKGGAAGILSGGLTDRQTVFETAVTYALSPFVVPHFYPGTSAKSPSTDSP